MNEMELRVRDLNPYKGLSQTDSHETYRVNAFVARKDYELIKNVCPMWGTVQTLLGLIFKSIADELRTNNTTDYNPNALFECVRRHTDLSNPQSGPQQDVPVGAKRVRRPVPRSSPTTRARRGVANGGGPTDAEVPSQFTLTIKTPNGPEQVQPDVVGG